MVLNKFETYLTPICKSNIRLFRDYLYLKIINLFIRTIFACFHTLIINKSNLLILIKFKYKATLLNIGKVNKQSRNIKINKNPK